MDLTFDQLLASLQSGMSKSASEGEDGKKDEKTEGKGENPFAKKDDKKDEKSEGKDSKDDKSDEDKKDDESKDDEGQTKEASVAGAALAREVAEQIASLNLGQGMNKQASTAGQALAQALLKQASAGDQTTSNGVPAGVTPNKLQVDNAASEGEGAATVKPMPTGDGVRNQGTVNEIFDAIVQDALNQGAASTDQVHESGYAKVEGAVEDHATPSQVKTAAEREDTLLKVAAIQELVSQGVSYEDALSMVKQAEQDIAYDMEKAAALEALVAENIDFDSAIELVKQASAGDQITDNGIPDGVTPNKLQVDNAASEAEGASYIKPQLTGDGIKNTGSVNEIFDAIVQDALSQGAASTDQVHERGVANPEGAVEEHAVPSQVKVAAMNSLLEQGIDFDEAAELITKAASAATLMLQGPGKAAIAAGKAKAAVGAAAGKLKSLAGAAKGDASTLVRGKVGGDSVISVNGKGRAVTGGRMDAAKGLAKNPLVQGGAAALAAGGATAALVGREKKAALDALVDAGVDYDSAVSLVESKAQELYGE